MALLKLDSVSSGYGRVPVLDRVSLQANSGQIIAIVGANGAGKSTLLKTISGLLKPVAGTIFLEGMQIGSLTPDRIVNKGVLHVAEGRQLFRSQTVHENLDLGLYGAGLSRTKEANRLEEIYTLFPILREKSALLAGSLSGGQQQMLAIGQALMRSPKLLMLDEPSLGLAPVVVDEVFDVLITLRAKNVGIILVEQLVERALDIADHVYVMTNGRISGDGKAAEIRDSDLLRNAYGGG